MASATGIGKVLLIPDGTPPKTTTLLVNGSEFLARISQLPPATQAELLTFATAGDYTTPTCPSCGTKMVLRTAKKGANAGDEFWGCRNYSRGCRRTFQIKSE